jgi:hypothetical protein
VAIEPADLLARLSLLTLPVAKGRNNQGNFEAIASFKMCQLPIERPKDCNYAAIPEKIQREH